MQWQPEYSLGIKEIDDQHKELIAKFSEVEKIVTDKNNWDKTHYALLELSRTVRRHFDFEEGLMRLFGIPNVEEHIKGHEYFFTKMADIENQSLRASAETDLIEFLYGWLRDQIMVADRKDFAAFILSMPQVVKSEAEGRKRSLFNNAVSAPSSNHVGAYLGASS